MTNTIIYYRDDYDWREEESSAIKYFTTLKNRVLIPDNSLVIPRFSALPFYKELEEDVTYRNSKLINTYKEHLYIADLMNWYEDLENFTPKTWERVEWAPSEGGPFVLKGETNSKKFLWKTHMFAKNKMDAIEVQSKLLQDGLIGDQRIYIREYIPLHEYGIALQNLPITKEFRFFFYKTTLLSGGFYWSNHIEDLNEQGIFPSVDDVPKAFLKKISSIVAANTNFFVIDVAQTKDGEWIVIELNDGSMSGLSCNDPDVLYSKLKETL